MAQNTADLSDLAKSVPEGAMRCCHRLTLPSHVSDVEVAMKLWLQHVWLEGGGLGAPAIENHGEIDQDLASFPCGRGCIRKVSGGIAEEILQIVRTDGSDINKADGKPDQSIHVWYRVRSGPFPVSFHLGCVTARRVGSSSDKADADESQKVKHGTVTGTDCKTSSSDNSCCDVNESASEVSHIDKANPAIEIIWSVDYVPYFLMGTMVRGVTSIALKAMLRNLRLRIQSDAAN